MAGMTIHLPGFTAVPVRGHDGSVWDVGVEWLPRTPRLLPRWRRWRHGKDHPADLIEAVDVPDTGTDLLGAVVGVVLAVVVAGVLLFLVVPALLLVVDVALLVVAVLGAVALKVLLRRPWRVVARCTSGPSAGERQVREVVGVRAARQARDALRAAVAGAAAP